MSRAASSAFVAAAGQARAIVLWCPDWPITALRLSASASASASAGAGAVLPDSDAPVALIDRGIVFACSASARAEGVRRGLRVREAQSRCSSLEVHPYDPVRDARAFEPIVAGIEEIMPGVQVLRPGTCALRARGPSRYYRGEDNAASILRERITELGVTTARVGIADGPFAAEQAARRSGEEGILVVPPGGSAAFLAPFPIEQVAAAPFSTLLRRLGIRTLGDLAALPARGVRDRFGAEGERAHLLASGRDPEAIAPRTPPQLREASLDFEPPLEGVDQLAFAFRTTADSFIAELTRAMLVCTAVTIELHSESGELHERTWLHPQWFTAADIVDRLRWQLQGSGSSGRVLSSPVSRIRVRPERIDDAAHHEAGLWGSGPDERVHHGLTRVQGILGHAGVVTAVVGGGRGYSDRQLLVPWGDRPPGGPAAPGAARSLPWPGSLPPPAPATLFESPRPIEVITSRGTAVAVDERGTLSAPPARFVFPELPAHEIVAWAGPWPVEERWWDPGSNGRIDRFQVVDDDGTAWLLAAQGERWWAEARYD